MKIATDMQKCTSVVKAQRGFSMMYDPIDFLVKESATTENIQSVLSEAVHGIGGIADVLYSGDLTGTDESTINDLGSALQLLNGVVNLSIRKLYEVQDQNNKSGAKK
ncbi:hypothetical protein B6C99_11730 [Gilliamella sp. N-G2]|nr:hypothetical protein B6C99_11730 [Gilliamella sp. N-G2]